MNKPILVAIICAIFTFNSTSSNAQLKTIPVPPGYNVKIENETIPDVNGSQYLSEEWTKGYIIMNNGSIVDTIDLRLNVYRNQLHYRRNGVEYAIGTPDKIKEIGIGNRRFIYYPYKEGEYTLPRFFEVLVEGKTELLVLFYITRITSNYATVLNSGEKNDRLSLEEKYFIKSGDLIIEHDRKGKKLMSLLGNNSEQLKKKIVEEDLSFKRKEDLVKIVTYVNEIN